MATINYAAREISVKIVYYGPGLSGKTTNLQIIHRKIPGNAKSDMVSLATETDRTLFFDFLPLDLGKIRGFTTKFQLYTVPGQVYYNATRKLVLRGVDGIVFIADSAADKLDENIESFKNMEENLAEYGYKRESIPVIVQYNKRDLPNALPVQEIDAKVNKYNLPWSEAISNKGKGVFESLKLIGKLVIDQLNQKYASSSTKKRPAAVAQRGPQQVPSYQPAQPRPVQPTPQPSPAVHTEQPLYTQQSPGVPSTMAKQQTPPSTPPPSGPTQYGTINLEPIAPQKQHQEYKPTPAAPKRSGASDLDLDMDRYYDQISQKRPSPAPSSFPSQGITPQRPYNDEPTFDPHARQNVPYQYQQPMPPPSQQQQQRVQPFAGPPPQQTQPSAQSGAYNYPPPPPEPQEPRVPSPPSQYAPDAQRMDATNEQLYFTSVNTDKYRRKAKKPVNPRHKQKTSFFKKLFNREE